MAKATTTRVIRAKGVPEVAQAQVMREITRPKIKAQTLAEQIAGDKMQHLNYMYPGGSQKWPHQKNMWYVDRFFPFAEGGPLAVDEANFMDDIETMKLKKHVLQERGIRYICIAPGMSELEVREQLA